MKTRTTTKVSSNTAFKGIHQHVNYNKYEARFTYGNRTYYIGSYNTLPEAVTARRNYILSLI